MFLSMQWTKSPTKMHCIAIFHTSIGPLLLIDRKFQEYFCEKISEYDQNKKTLHKLEQVEAVERRNVYLAMVTLGKVRGTS